MRDSTSLGPPAKTSSQSNLFDFEPERERKRKKKRQAPAEATGPTAELPADPEPQQKPLTFDAPAVVFVPKVVAERKRHAPAPRPPLQDPPPVPEKRPNIHRALAHSNLHARDQNVLMKLIGFADYDTGRNARPKYRTLAKKCGVSVDTVKRSVPRLEAGSWIVRTGYLPGGVIEWAVNFWMLQALAEPAELVLEPTPGPRKQKLEITTLKQKSGEVFRSSKMPLLKPGRSSKMQLLIDQSPRDLTNYVQQTSPDSSRLSANSAAAAPAGDGFFNQEDWERYVDEWHPGTRDPERLAELPGFRTRIKTTLRTRTETALLKAWETHLRKNL